MNGDFVTLGPIDEKKGTEVEDGSIAESFFDIYPLKVIEFSSSVNFTDLQSYSESTTMKCASTCGELIVLLDSSTSFTEGDSVFHDVNVTLEFSKNDSNYTCEVNCHSENSNSFDAVFHSMSFVSEMLDEFYLGEEGNMFFTEFCPLNSVIA